MDNESYEDPSQNLRSYYTTTSARQTTFGVTAANPSHSLVMTHNCTEFARVEADGTVRCNIDKLLQYLLDNPAPKPGHELMHSVMLLAKHMYYEGRDDGYYRGQKDGYVDGYDSGYECGYDNAS